MKLVIIFGPHAVGKMTIGQELTKLTQLRLFHNHMTIDVVMDLFNNMPSERSRLTRLFRQEIFDAYSKSSEYGMIFTYMCAFDTHDDWDYLNQLETMFLSRGADVFYVELEADYDLRIERNKTPNRLLNKSTKRDVVKSELVFRSLEEKYRLNSIEGEIKKDNYLRINNTDLKPEMVAKMIQEKFSL